MSLFIQNNSGPIYSDCTITIHNGQTTVETPTHAEKPEAEEANETPYQPPIPQEGNYNAVREYIVERKKYDEDFRIYWNSHTLKQNCVYLSREFEWIVDDHSLGTNLNRHRVTT